MDMGLLPELRLGRVARPGKFAHVPSWHTRQICTGVESERDYPDRDGIPIAAKPVSRRASEEERSLDRSRLLLGICEFSGRSRYAAA